jgi:chromate transporter
VIGGAIWLAPLAATYFALGHGNVFTAIAAFNSKMAVVTFGGAYAVLAYMAQQAVEYYHWLKPDEMLVGLGFAETTPGPLISVVQFVGFMAAFRNPGALDPVLAGTLGGVLAMWATFVPPFIWIFVGGPYIEALLGNKALHAALSAITAAIVGVILNLAVWFGLHLLFHGEISMAAIDWPALVLTLAAIVAMFRFRAGMIPTLAACSAAGALYYLATGAA